MLPRIAVTLGDPRGIGPEIVAKTLDDKPAEAEYVVIGPSELIEGLPVEQVAIGSLREAGSWKREAEGAKRTALPPYRLTAESLSIGDAGRLTGLAVEKAVSLAMARDVDAIVTAPAEKRALHVAGFEFPGHTEWLAHLAGGVDVAMMLATEDLKVVLVTTHVPLSKVAECITTERVVRVGQIASGALRQWWGIKNPKLAVCALNPHAGESGLFGDEDRTILRPAAELLDAEGPIPADTVFVRALRGEFDAVLAPYHDVGMTAVKVAAFGRSVNVTLGLPFVRTSPDHGTAFDIAGKGIADASSMKEAVSLAVRLVKAGA